MDIVESEYMKNRYPDRQEKELKEISKCYSCGEILYRGDEVVENFGYLSCNLIECVIKMTESKVIILEELED